MTHLSNLTRKLQFHEGKLVFTGGKIEALNRGEPGRIAFTKACCCNVPCNRVVIMLTIGISGNTTDNIFPPAQDDFPVEKNGGREGTTLLWHYWIHDTVGDDAGKNYHQHTWVAEYCYSDYDLRGDMMAPAESFYNEVLEWGCATEKEWINAVECFNTVVYVDDPYCEKTYYDIREEIRDSFDDLTNCAWIDSDEYGPYVESQCPDCTCDYSCVDPCPEIEIGSTIHARKMYLVKISADSISGLGPTLPGIEDPDYSSYGSSTRVVWKAHAYDQFPNANKGNNYHTIFWAVEICYNSEKEYCTLDGSNGFENYLDTWACDAEKAWNNNTFCATNIIEVAEADHNAAYYANILQAEENSIASIATAADSDVLTTPPIDYDGTCGDEDDRQIGGANAFISGDYDEGEV